MRITNLKPIQQTVIKGKNRNTRKSCEVCSKLTIKTPGGVAVITTAKLHSTKPELRFCAGSIPARGVSEIGDGEDLW